LMLLSPRDGSILIPFPEQGKGHPPENVQGMSKDIRCQVLEEEENPVHPC
jgi:hypothetical protein